MSSDTSTISSSSTSSSSSSSRKRHRDDSPLADSKRSAKDFEVKSNGFDIEKVVVDGRHTREKDRRRRRSRSRSRSNSRSRRSPSPSSSSSRRSKRRRSPSPRDRPKDVAVTADSADRRRPRRSRSRSRSPSNSHSRRHSRSESRSRSSSPRRSSTRREFGSEVSLRLSALSSVPFSSLEASAEVLTALGLPSGFSSTKHKLVESNKKAGFIRLKSRRQAVQIMNRRKKNKEKPKSLHQLQKETVGN